MKKVIIVAVDKKGWIGKNGGRPWDFPADLEHFRRVVAGSPVIMGRKTFETDAKGALAYSPTVVLTRQERYEAGDAKVCHSLEEAVAYCQSLGVEVAYIGGGEKVYREAMGLVDELIVTYLPVRIDGDSKFPEIDPEKWEQTMRKRLKDGGEVVWYARKNQT